MWLLYVYIHLSTHEISIYIPPSPPPSKKKIQGIKHTSVINSRNYYAHKNIQTSDIVYVCLNISQIRIHILTLHPIPSYLCEKKKAGVGGVA